MGCWAYYFLLLWIIPSFPIWSTRSFFCSETLKKSNTLILSSEVEYLLRVLEKLVCWCILIFKNLEIIRLSTLRRGPSRLTLRNVHGCFMEWSTIASWWLGHPSEKYEFVNWDDEIPNINGKIQNSWQPKHQPDWVYLIDYWDNLPGIKWTIAGPNWDAMNINEQILRIVRYWTSPPKHENIPILYVMSSPTEIGIGWILDELFAWWTPKIDESCFKRHQILVDMTSQKNVHGRTIEPSQLCTNGCIPSFEMDDNCWAAPPIFNHHMVYILSMYLYNLKYVAGRGKKYRC